MFGTKYLNDEHGCNVVSMNSFNIQNANDDCTSHEKNVWGCPGRHPLFRLLLSVTLLGAMFSFVK